MRTETGQLIYVMGPSGAGKDSLLGYARERLAEQPLVFAHRYITRPALSDERVQVNAAGQVELKLKTPWRDGTTHLVLSPLEFMQRLAALVPRPRLHLIRFHGVLAPNASGEQSLDRVLMRLRVESCNNVASAMPARPAINPNDPAAYKPQTQYDNTPWRFDMSQNGKRMTADEFDAWMKARGVRVVKAAATPAAEGAAEAKAAAEVK